MRWTWRPLPAGWMRSAPTARPYHWVDGAHALGTLQIGQPAWIAEAVGVPVVSDVRIRDVTVGGHGAPLVSFLDDLLLRGRGEVAAALNLGGISNMTVVRDGSVTAYDIRAGERADRRSRAGAIDAPGRLRRGRPDRSWRLD